MRALLLQNKEEDAAKTDEGASLSGWQKVALGMTGFYGKESVQIRRANRMYDTCIQRANNKELAAGRVVPHSACRATHYPLPLESSLIASVWWQPWAWTTASAPCIAFSHFTYGCASPSSGTPAFERHKP